jgi:hypothetical protein
VAASVHLAGGFAAECDVGLLVDRQRIDISPKCDARPVAPPQRGDDPRLRNWIAIRNLQLIERAPNQRAGAHLFVPELRMPMNLTTDPGDPTLFGVRGFEEIMHGRKVVGGQWSVEEATCEILSPEQARRNILTNIVTRLRFRGRLT